MIRVSKTSLETAARCPRLYQYRYPLNKTTVFSNDILTFGVEFHEGLDFFWNNKGKYTVNADLFDDPDQAIICQALLDSYNDRYSLDEVEVILVEEKFEVETDYGHRVAIFDGIVKYRGRTLLVESKTTRSYIDDKSFYWNRLDLDLQIGYYVWFAEQVGHKVDGVLYDVSRVPKMKMGKDGRKVIDETPEMFYDRVFGKLMNNPDDYHVRRLLNPDVEEVMKQVDMWEKTMHWYEENQHFPKNHTSCQMYGRTCEFKPVCTGSTTLDNERLYQIRKP